MDKTTDGKGMLTEKEIRQIWDDIVFDNADKGDVAWAAVRKEAPTAVIKRLEEELERLRQRLTESSYMVEDEHHEMWWTMPVSFLDNIFADFGLEKVD